MIGETALQDIRVGARVLLREKGFCALAIAVLAIGIAAVTTQFTVINAVVLRGLSFAHPEQLVDVTIADPVTLAQQGGSSVDPNDYLDMLRQQQSFSALSGYLNGSTVNTTIDGVPSRHTGGYVTETFFSILGVRPFLGRDFSAADNRPGAARTVVIGYDLWQKDYHGDTGVIGRSITVNGQIGTVIGVMPSGFKFPVSEELWVPIFNQFPVLPRGDLQTVPLAILGRLKPGVSIDQAAAEFTAIAKRLALENPKTNKLLTTARVQPLVYQFVGPGTRGQLYGMLAAVVAVLLIACVNVMNMQFARATLRAKEVAVRGALGASRWRLVRQMLTESLLLAGAGALLGVLMSEWALMYLTHSLGKLSFPLPYWIQFTIDVPVLIVTVGIAVFSAVASGLLPALVISRANPATILKEGGRGNSSRLTNLLTRGLVVAQIALTSALLVACTLQIRSLSLQRSRDTGFDEHGVYSARMGLFQTDYPTGMARTAFYAKVLRELRADPAIASASVTTRFQMLFNFPAPIEIQGRTYATEHDRPTVMVESVGDDYFNTLGIPLVEGRAFTADDSDEHEPVAVINRSFAIQMFGRADPIGQKVRGFLPGTDPASNPWRTIVGVVPDLHMQGPFTNNSGQVIEQGLYTPLKGPLAPQFATLLARPRGGSAETLATAVQRDVQRADPNLPLYFLGTPYDLHQAILGQVEVVATMFTAFGIAALILSAAGLYGLMTFSVTQRTLEFGIRMALGAKPGDIFGIVLLQGGTQLAIGLSLGLGMAVTLILMAGASRIASVMPFESPRDPVIYGTVIAVLSTVTFIACLGPASRATRVQPMIALRSE